jgi:FkbM family methyltransferase
VRETVLPNGRAIFHASDDETRFLYHEIFDAHEYLAHGVTCPANAVVIDAGANIGLFALSLHWSRPGTRVYAFEPAPTFDILAANFARHGVAGAAEQVAITNACGTTSFTFYPEVSGMSGRYADPDVDAAVVKRLLVNREPLLAPHVHQIVAGKLVPCAMTCRTITISDAIRDRELDRIDLLKLDVEGSERDALAGVAAAHWPRIAQVVVEVHGDAGDVARLLHDRGFEVAIDGGGLRTGTGLYGVYARRGAVS